MKAWFEFLEELFSAVSDMAGRSKRLMYRGHSNNSYTLLPSLLREAQSKAVAEAYSSGARSPEQSLFFDFVSKSTTKFESSWHTLYLMQHHALPTRLLDWTESLGVALYFAISDSKPGVDAMLWLLDPHALNEESNQNGVCGLINPEIGEIPEYSALLGEGFLKYSKPLALLPTRRNGRMIAQRGTFTLHGNDKRPVEEIFKGSAILQGIRIPAGLHGFGRSYLNIMGLDRYTLFPDDDNLARSIFEGR